MNWQDLVIIIGNVIFIIALIPSVTSKDKPSVLTSLPTSGVLFAFSMVYVSLNLWGSFITTLTTSLLLLILAIQKLKSANKKS